MYGMLKRRQHSYSLPMINWNLSGDESTLKAWREKYIENIGGGTLNNFKLEPIKLNLILDKGII